MRKKLMLFVAIIVGIGSFVLYRPDPVFKSKDITPTSTKFSRGDLAEYLELVGPYELVYSEVHTAEKLFYGAREGLELRVQIKLIKDSIEAESPVDLSFEDGRVATVELMNENNSFITEMELDKEERIPLRELLLSPAGSIREFTFRAYGCDDDSEALTWFRSACKFKPSFTDRIILPSK